MERDVAIKVINRSLIANDMVLEHFQREARVIARLEHPNLLPIYDYNGKHDPPYIVMRYLATGTLEDMLKSRRLLLFEIASMMRQITSALDYAHRQEVIHRDIKPSNIMVDEDGNTLLMDLGIARLNEGNENTGLTQTGFAIGTPGYMSPEQARIKNLGNRDSGGSLGVFMRCLGVCLSGATQRFAPTVRKRLCRGTARAAPTHDVMVFGR